MINKIYIKKYVAENNRLEDLKSLRTKTFLHFKNEFNLSENEIVCDSFIRELSDEIDRALVTLNNYLVKLNYYSDDILHSQKVEALIKLEQENFFKNSN